MKINSHVQFGKDWSMSKVIFTREWQALAVGNLQEWLFAHFAVTAIETVPHSDVQVQIRVTFKAVTSPAKQRDRAFAIDGFIGGWLAARKDFGAL